MATSTPAITILVSVYNTISFLPRFFEALETQSFQDYEVIFVDDLSDDGSLEYCLEKSAANSKYLVVRGKEKMYPDKARFLGFRQARGEYVIYLDSDDEFSSDYLASLYSLAKENDLDFAVSTCQRIDEESKPTRKAEYLFPKSMPLLTDKQKTKLLKGRYGGWNRLCKKTFLDRYGYNYSQAELPLFLMHFYSVARVGYTHDGLYWYRERSGSISRKNVSRRFKTYDCLEPLEWFKREVISKDIIDHLSVYVYRMILPYILYKKYFCDGYDYKRKIKRMAKTLNYSFFKGLKYWFLLSKRDKFIFAPLLFHVYWPAFFFISKYRT